MRMTPMAVRQFPFDQQMVELPQATDRVIVAALFRKYLRDEHDRPLDVTGCRILRLRYRPERRCVVQYSVTTCDGHTGALHTRIVTGTMYGNRERSARHAREDGNATFIPELRMVVRMFPSDRKLTHARPLVVAAQSVVAPAILNAFGPDFSRVVGWKTDIVRYREGLSLVLRYTVTACRRDSGETQEQTFYVKAYPDGGAAVGVTRYLDALAGYSRRHGEMPRVYGPLTCLAALGAVLFRATPGRPLSDIISGGTLNEAVAAAGRSARGLAQFNLSDAPTVRAYGVVDYADSLDRPVAALERACPEIASALGRIRTRTRALPAVALHPTHRDMKPDHVLLGTESVAFIDLDSCAAADPVLDVSLMLARFAGLVLAGQSRARVTAVAAIFAREYFARVPAAWLDRLPVYYASSLVEVASSLFHRQEPEWRRDVPKLVRLADDVLANHSCLSPDSIGGLVRSI